GTIEQGRLERLAAARPHANRVRAARAFPAPSTPGAHPRAAAGGRLGRRARERQRRGGLCRLPTPEAGRHRRDAADPHRARYRLRPPGGLVPLRLRLALFGVAVVALTLVIFASLLYALVSGSVNSNQDDALRSRAHEALAALSASPALTARAPIAPADLRSSGDVFVEVFDPGWTVVYSTAELNGAPPMPSA